jgi:calcineurin-like phosphoesterase family protein
MLPVGPIISGVPLAMAVARFLQISDLHLGRPFGWLPPERRAERRADQRRALEQLVREAIERGAHAILIPGDLFDVEGVDAGTMAFAINVFGISGCPPVFIAPGNHDPWSESSHLWAPRLLRARGWAWPAHVHIFNTGGWTMKRLPGLPAVRIWGRAFTSHAESRERPLREGSIILPDSADAMGLEIALFHGSREGQCPPWQSVTAPFTDREVGYSPFGYHAVGHYHVPSWIERKATDQNVSTAGKGVSGAASGGVRLAYAGSAIALDTTETGAHGALEVCVEYGQRQPVVEIEPVELDERRVYEVQADVTGAASAEQVDARVQRAMEEAGVAERDIVTVRLSGRLMRGVRYAGPGSQVHPKVFHMRLDLRAVRPDYDLSGYRRPDPTTTEERFAATLLGRLDAEKDPAQRALLESALYYGLDAFRLREIVPSYEDLGT